MPTVTHYNGALTRESFLLNEMRLTARLYADEHLQGAAVQQQICENNLFQYPTERSQRSLSKVCCRWLERLSQDKTVREQLIDLIAHGTTEQAAQTALYAIMCDNRLVWEFMVYVIGGKFRRNDLFLSNREITTFIHGLASQDATLASWSDATCNKIRQVLNRMLVDTGMKSSVRSEQLIVPYLDGTLKQAICSNGDKAALAAFGVCGEV